MGRKLRVLHVEDSDADAQLVARALREAGQDVACTRVENEADYLRELEAPPDVVIADYRLPRFTGLRALELLRERHPEVPFIIVSGTIGEEKAAETIRLGADDYLLKDRMARLPAAVRNAVNAAAERAGRRKAQSELDALGQRLKSVVTALPDVVWSIALPSQEVLYVSPAARSLFGRAPREFYEDRKLWLSLVHPDDRARMASAWENAEAREYRSQYRIQRPSGEVRWVEARGRTVADASGKVVRADGILRDVTELVLLNETLREREAGLRRAQVMAKLAHVVTGPGGRFESWSETLPQLAGVAPDNVPDSVQAWMELVHPDDRAGFRATAIEAARLLKHSQLEYRMRRPAGGLIHVCQTMEPLSHDEDSSDPLRWFNTLQDITEQKTAAERIRRLNRVYAVLSAINGAIIRIRSRDELFSESCRIAVQIGGFLMAWIGDIDHGAGVVRPVAWAGERVPGDHGLAGRAVREKRPVVSSDTAVLPLMLRGEPVGVLALHAAEPGFFDEEELRLIQELAGDIAFALDHIEKEERVGFLAYYDALTGLANRALLLQRLAEQVAAAREHSEHLALLVVNIDRFKSVNDSLGRQAGDELLRHVARRLGAGAGDASRVARVGADEFAVILPQVASRQQLARRLRRGAARTTHAPFVIDGRELRVSFRAGVAMFPDDGADADTLFRNAEAALRKARSGEDFVFYAPQMTERVAEKLELENQLRLAVERSEFVLHYQPKFDLATRRITGVEALIRWRSPGLGLVPPAQFIPVLEETGLIAPVGAWALAQAVEDQQRWRGLGHSAPRISVNVSALELRRADFVTAVKKALARGTAPAIDLEITETLLMEDIERSIEKLKALRQLGVGVAIDDFGTGYSSLGYLARLPVQALKVDRSFIVTMLENEDVMTLVSTMVSLSHTLRLTVVAEGVDSEAQARALYLLRCDEVQGYLFGKPMPFDEISALLRTA